MNVIAKLTVLLLFNVTVISCFDGLTGVKGNGNVITENRDLTSNFNEITVKQGINLVITQGNSTELTVEADENIIELLITEVVDNNLKIYFKENVNRADAKNVYLTTDKISKISTSSGALVKSENKLQTNNLELHSSSGSSIKLDISSNDVQSSTSSGANMKIIGQSKSFYGKASSGSSINAEQLESIDADVKVSSGANIQIYVSEELTAKASSGGSINYKGSPSKINKEASSGGSISGS